VVISLFAMMFHSDLARRLRNKPAWTKEYRIFAAGRDQPTSSGSKRFAIDSPLEEQGFELAVPLGENGATRLPRKEMPN
jgi:hypothetical protein